MEKEIFRKILYYEDYNDDKIFKTAVQKEYEEIKKKYPSYFVTKDFINQRDIVIKVIQITDKWIKPKEQDKDKNRDRADGFRCSSDRERC